MEPPLFEEESFEIPHGKVFKIEKIIDFNFRLQHYPEDKKKIILEAREKAQYMYELNSMQDWTTQVEDKTNNIVLEYRSNEYDLILGRSRCTIPFKPKDVMNTCLLVDRLPETYPNVEEFKFLEKIGVNTFKIYQKIKKIVIVSARDFVIYQQVNKNSDGSYYLVKYSDPDDATAHIAGVVRAHMVIGGLIIKPHPQYTQQSLVTSITHLDLKGNLPKMIQKQANY